MSGSPSAGNLPHHPVKLRKGPEMRIAPFIRANEAQIIGEWEDFARTLGPAADVMTPRALRDHVKDILCFIADDIESNQTNAEQVEKSHGAKDKDPETSAAEIHAAFRLSDGFSMDQMVSEYRALRASVIKLWSAQITPEGIQDTSDLIRFVESIDQALTESISHYTIKIDNSRDLFLGILCHDLRNPLGAIAMAGKLVLSMGALSERQATLVSQTMGSAGRAMEIVDYLVDLIRTRLGSGLPINREPMDMGVVSRQMIDEMRALHPGRDIRLETSGDLAGKWDKARIGQVLSNLLGNAVRYGFADSPISVAVKGDPGEVILSVHNEGIPIPRDSIGRIFESLTRAEVKDGNDHPGAANLGLGLYITKEVVAAHGGAIGVVSSKEHGTTFTARFPRSR